MKVSILSACRNKRQFVEDAYKSVCEQKYTNWEWIIVDDSSTDGSDDFIRKNIISEKIKKIYSSTRLWCGGAYNLALEHMTGDICVVLDMDDYLMPHAIEEIVAVYKKYPEIGYLYTQHDICDKNLKKIKNGVSCLPDPGKSFAEMVHEKKHCFSHCRTFKYEIIEESLVPLFPGNLKCCVDKNLGFALEETAIGGFYDRVTYQYRWYMGNMTTTAPGGSNKRKWSKLAGRYVKRRFRQGIETFPVISVSLDTTTLETSKKATEGDAP